MNLNNIYWAGKKESEKNEAASQSSSVEVISNHIYFYSSIDPESILKLNKTLRDTTSKIANQAYSLGIDKNLVGIFLHINSEGGSFHDGMAASDEIRINDIDVTTIIDGFCASAGTLLSCAGKIRWIHKHAHMLIHQISAGFYGKHDELKDREKNLDALMEMIKNFYKEYTKVPSEKIDKILKHDLYFNAKECLDYGLVDKIIGG